MGDTVLYMVAGDAAVMGMLKVQVQGCSLDAGQVQSDLASRAKTGERQAEVGDLPAAHQWVDMVSRM